MNNRKGNLIMHELRESDSPVVSKKRPNNGGEQLSFCFAPAEGVEKRGLAKENAFKHPKVRTQRRAALQRCLDRIRRVANTRKGEPLTALYHHVYSTDTLLTSFYSLKRDSAAGVDHVTWSAYEEDLDANLTDLSHRLQLGTYRPEPVMRTFIPKAGGRLRPIGIPVLEDKIVEKAVVFVLNQVYEEEFVNFTYGFRPKRNQHQALDAVAMGIESRRINWILDADLAGFFDHLSHDWLIKFVEHRIKDRRIIRLIGRWLNAGVLEKDVYHSTDEGTPQGGSISPLLANIYLHYVLDLWVNKWRTDEATGDVIIVRYADDFIVGFQSYKDAQQFRFLLQQRLQKFNLMLNASKTRLIEFGRYAKLRRAKRGLGKPETFEFLGFTHACGRFRKGHFHVERRTSMKRLRAKLKEIKQELRYRLHWKVRDVGQWLRRVLIGHYRYYGVPYNMSKLYVFYNELVRLWFRQLKRRSQRTTINWARMTRIKDQWLPQPQFYHPFPSERLVV
jgi:group II intron reverse transcriptase/maturase